MSVKKVKETTSEKILNSDIYDITRFVDDIKKKNILNTIKENLERTIEVFCSSISIP